MREIYGADKAVIGICTEQNVRQTPYRLSHYCVEVPCEEGLLLYHTLTGAVWLLPFGETVETNRDALVRQWFLVPTDFDEAKWVEDIKRVARLLSREKKHLTSFTIFPTTDCNARCFYCYEHGIKKLTMDEKTAKAVASYIIRKSGGEKVTLRWFGGEPFYNPAAIDVICGALQNAGINYHSFATSNGYFLDAQTAKKAAEFWRLEGVQIAIDGTEEVYNRTKAYVCNDANAYQRVMENIAALMNAGIRVTVRMNLHGGNAENLEALCDELAERFPNREKLRIHVIALKNQSGKGRIYADENAVSAICERINRKIEDMGCALRFGLMRGIVDNQCMADNPICEVIFPDGTTGRCEHYDEKEITGTVFSDERNAAVVQSWKEREEYAECPTCALYPCCIKLKKCFWQNASCTERDRSRRIARVRQSVLEAYHNGDADEPKQSL